MATENDTMACCSIYLWSGFFPLGIESAAMAKPTIKRTMLKSVQRWFGHVLMSSPKRLGHAASDFEELSVEELEGINVAAGRKGFGVPALYKRAHAYQDGLRPGDIILSLDGRSFDSTASLNNYIRTKPELDIVIEYLRNGRIYNVETKLHAEQDLQEECWTIEELRELADFGNPYAALQVRSSLGKMHWDFLGLDSLAEAQKKAEDRQRPLLAGLFGSSVCCVHLAPWTPPYKTLITHPSIQKSIRDRYVSLLVLKPEAYHMYRQYLIDSRFPALLRITEQGELESLLSLRREARVSDLLSFFQEKTSKPDETLVTMEELPSNYRLSDG